MLTDLKPLSQPWNITEDASEHILESYLKTSLWSRSLNPFFFDSSLEQTGYLKGGGVVFFLSYGSINQSPFVS